MALNLAVYLKQEDDLLPWLVAQRALAFLDDRLGGLAEGSLVRPLAAALLRPLYLDAQFDVGGDPATPHAALLRELVVTWACRAGLAECLDHASGLYQSWRHDNQYASLSLHYENECNSHYYTLWCLRAAKLLKLPPP